MFLLVGVSIMCSVVVVVVVVVVVFTIVVLVVLLCCVVDNCGCLTFLFHPCQPFFPLVPFSAVVVALKILWSSIYLLTRLMSGLGAHRIYFGRNFAPVRLPHA